MIRKDVKIPILTSIETFSNWKIVISIIVALDVKSIAIGAVENSVTHRIDRSTWDLYQNGWVCRVVRVHFEYIIEFSITLIIVNNFKISYNM
jgi:hypothetical protein